MTKMYVLMEEGWEYNDEIMFRPESGGGTPRKVFTALSKAQKECDSLNVKELRKLFAEGEITEYFYGWDELLPRNERKSPEFRERLDKACTKVFGMDFDALGNYFDAKGWREAKHAGLQSATEKDWTEFLNCTKLRFWEVVEVEKG